MYASGLADTNVCSIEASLPSVRYGASLYASIWVSIMAYASFINWLSSCCMCSESINCLILPSFKSVDTIFPPYQISLFWSVRSVNHDLLSK